MQDRALLQRRALKGLEAAPHFLNGDASQMAVVGYGFGGVCALDVARSGAQVRGAVSVYGHFDPPPADLCRPIQEKILILHGNNDPIVSQEVFS